MGGALEKGVVGVVLLIFLIRVDKVVDATKWDSLIRMPSAYADEELNGTRWAILVAGSYGFGNYRHQADVCHAYQILKKGGLKDENIVVFMYDDIASNPANPHPGTIINHPQGEDVYAGVLKDYTGGNVNVNNFYAVLLGNRSSINGGSGKVIDSGPNDHIFIYYSDHGGPGVLGMPTPPYLYAIDFVEALKKKHASGTYKEMVIYVEACESGSIFEGLLPNDLNIYVTTAANAEETSWGTYCPGMTPSPPAEYQTCLGDLYSVAWMEDSEAHNLKKETLLQQYELEIKALITLEEFILVNLMHWMYSNDLNKRMTIAGTWANKSADKMIVRSRTSNHNIYSSGSHVMQYGDLAMNKEHLYLYMGFDPANVNETPSEENILDLFPKNDTAKAVNQREADLLYLWHKFKRAKEDSPEKLEAQRHIVDLMQHRMHLDRSLKLIGKLLFGSHRGANMFKEIRPAGQPIVDDWNCLKTMVRTFESHCGFLSQYGMKYMRAVGNICNAGVTAETMAEGSSAACGSTIYTPHGLLNSLKGGFSA